MESKLKYLQFIQDVITRMNTNSFLIKGWIATLVSALFALAGKDSNLNLVYIAWFALIIFWVMDGFYLSQERQYRRLYDHARNLQADDVNFDMNAKPYNQGKTGWWASIFSRTLLLFYLTFFVVTLVVTILMFK